MFEVYAGGDSAAIAHRHAYEEAAMALGLASFWIPLNGGREEREDMRVYWRQYAEKRRIPCRVLSCMIVVGGRHQSGRGRRYVERKDDGATRLEWIEWRRAKRLARKRVAVVLNEAA